MFILVYTYMESDSKIQKMLLPIKDIKNIFEHVIDSKNIHTVIRMNYGQDVLCTDTIEEIHKQINGGNYGKRNNI